LKILIIESVVAILILSRYTVTRSSLGLQRVEEIVDPLTIYDVVFDSIKQDRSSMASLLKFNSVFRFRKSITGSTTRLKQCITH